MGHIRQQQHACGVGHDLNDLPHQPAGIKHWLAKKHAVALALVDQDAVRERVRVQADKLTDDYLVIHQRSRIEQLAQAHVLLRQHRELLQTPLHEQCFGLQLFVFGHQAGAAADLLGGALPGAHRQIGKPIEGCENQPHLTAQWLQGIEARIHHHQRDTKHSEHQQAHTEQRSFCE